MPDTFIKIASVTVGSGGAGTITFTSIPSTYTDLQVMLSLRSTGSTFENVTINFNGVTSNQYSDRTLQGNGSAASSSQNNSISAMYPLQANGNTTANTFSNAYVYVPNYAGSNNKSVSVDSVTEDNSSTAFARLVSGLWSNSSAITSITFTITGNSIAQYSTATLYGIKNS